MLTIELLLEVPGLTAISYCPVCYDDCGVRCEVGNHPRRQVAAPAAPGEFMLPR
jgi:hypothetical protein